MRFEVVNGLASPLSGKRPRGVILPATALTRGNPARYAKTGQFDPDSTRQSLRQHDQS